MSEILQKTIEFKKLGLLIIDEEQRFGVSHKERIKEMKKEIERIQRKTDIKVLISLSCTMCPDTVVAAQYIAAKNPKVTAEIYDVQLFEEMKNRYSVMSVPCIVVNDSKVAFGRKNIKQILALLEE